MTLVMPTIGRIVLYRTDGRNGLVYDLPAIVTCTADTHPGDYPDGKRNPLPVPRPGCVHLTVFTPGGFGSEIRPGVDPTDGEWKGAAGFTPGSGTYVEWDVRPACDPARPGPRSWRWPERQPEQPGRAVDLEVPAAWERMDTVLAPPPCGPRRRWPFSRRRG